MQVLFIIHAGQVQPGTWEKSFQRLGVDDIQADEKLGKSVERFLGAVRRNKLPTAQKEARKLEAAEGSAVALLSWDHVDHLNDIHELLPSVRFLFVHDHPELLLPLAAEDSGDYGAARDVLISRIKAITAFCRAHKGQTMAVAGAAVERHKNEFLAALVAKQFIGSTPSGRARLKFPIQAPDEEYVVYYRILSEQDAALHAEDSRLAALYCFPDTPVRGSALSAYGRFVSEMKAEAAALGKQKSKITRLQKEVDRLKGELEGLIRQEKHQELYVAMLREELDRVVESDDNRKEEQGLYLSQIAALQAHADQYYQQSREGLLYFDQLTRGGSGCNFNPFLVRLVRNFYE